MTVRQWEENKNQNYWCILLYTFWYTLIFWCYQMSKSQIATVFKDLACGLQRCLLVTGRLPGHWRSAEVTVSLLASLGVLIGLLDCWVFYLFEQCCFVHWVFKAFAVWPVGQSKYLRNSPLPSLYKICEPWALNRKL